VTLIANNIQLIGNNPEHTISFDKKTEAKRVSAPTKSVNMHVYANPTNTRFNIAILDLNNASMLKLINSQGQIVSDQSVTSDMNNFTIDVESLAPGIYFVEVLEGNRVLAREKVVVRR